MQTCFGLFLFTPCLWPHFLVELLPHLLFMLKVIEWAVCSRRLKSISSRFILGPFHTCPDPLYSEHSLPSFCPASCLSYCLLYFSFWNLTLSWLLSVLSSHSPPISLIAFSYGRSFFCFQIFVKICRILCLSYCSLPPYSLFWTIKYANRNQTIVFKGMTRSIHCLLWIQCHLSQLKCCLV